MNFFLSFQDLPKVPVPPLEQTLTEYLRILEPVLTQQQHDKTKMIVKNFTGGLGPILQEYLQEKRENEDNWVSKRKKLKKHFIRLIPFII